MDLELISMQNQKWLKNRWNTLRRWYVDEFCFNYIAHLPVGTNVLDLGGHKIKPAGSFNISSFNFNKCCLNINSEKGADIVGDGAAIPLKTESFECVVLSEVLEHVRAPQNVMKEVHRVLKPNGKVFITVPFMYRIHADPYDYGRYTDQFWKELLNDLGFKIVILERHGAFWSVLLDPIRIAWAIHNKNNTHIYTRVFGWIIYKMTTWAILKDKEVDQSFQKYYSSFTTGFGIVAEKYHPATQN